MCGGIRPRLDGSVCSRVGFALIVPQREGILVYWDQGLLLRLQYSRMMRGGHLFERSTGLEGATTRRKS